MSISCTVRALALLAAATAVSPSRVFAADDDPPRVAPAKKRPADSPRSSEREKEPDGETPPPREPKPDAAPGSGTRSEETGAADGAAAGGAKSRGAAPAKGGADRAPGR